MIVLYTSYKETHYKGDVVYVLTPPVIFVSAFLLRSSFMTSSLANAAA